MCRWMVCCLSDQRYNFLKANHNVPYKANLRWIVVYQIKDTIFWKQITTAHLLTVRYSVLFIRSKIQFFESKSQLPCCFGVHHYGCLSDQRYNFLKANHNFAGYRFYRLRVVYQIKDTIFWKQITTIATTAVVPFVLFIRSKIQFFESKSQLRVRNTFQATVVYQIKDTIFWKQITTALIWTKHHLTLFIRSKIQFFESKSQLPQSSIITSSCCLSDQRYNFLKAIHNKHYKSTSYTTSRNGLEPLCAKEVLFLLL